MPAPASDGVASRSNSSEAYRADRMHLAEDREERAVQLGEHPRLRRHVYTTLSWRMTAAISAVIFSLALSMHIVFQ